MGYTQESSTLTLSLESGQNNSNVAVVTLTNSNPLVIANLTTSCTLSSESPSCVVHINNLFNPYGGSSTITASANNFNAASSSVTVSSAPFFTWVSGESIANQLGVYGTKGIASVNNITSAMIASISWYESGKFWLFGGEGYDGSESDELGLLSDLWQYDIASNKWTWVSGESILNQPGVYGTKGVPSSSNMPGARYGAISWYESGNLWLFGGESTGSELTDLWRYNIASNKWTWVSGSRFTGQVGVYGTKGVPSSSNMPGSRYQSIGWYESGNLWLFGGSGYAASGPDGGLNDLWKYNIASNQWAWVGGESVIDSAGVYGCKGVPSISNIPGARDLSISWYESGNLWLFGGAGFDSVESIGGLNDLWKYNIISNKWTWISGESVVDQIGIYGSKGIASPSNIPGAMAPAVSWCESGNLCLFGGAGYMGAGSVSFFE